MTKITLTNLKSDFYKSSASWCGHLILFILLLSAQFSSAQVAVIENFNGTLPAGWTSTLYSTTAAPCEGTASFRSNLYAFNLTAAVTTNNYVGVSNGTDVTVNFQWKTTEYSVGSGVGVTANVEYSINNGTTWLAAGPAINSSAITTCGTYSSTIPAASVPLNSDFKFRISASQTTGDFYFYVDQFSITQVTTVAPQCTTLVSPANGAVDINSSVITWSPAAGIPTGYVLSVGTTAGGTEIINAVDVGNVTTYTLPALGLNTMYYVRVVPYNANGSATACTESNFTSCGAVTVLPWTENFDSMTTLGNFYPGCWFMENGAWMTGNAAANTYTDPRSGSNYLFNNWGAANEYMWTKGFSLTAGTSYDFSTFVQGDNGTNWVVAMFVNNSQISTGATQLGGNYNVLGTGAPYGPQTYVEMRRTFVPTTTGIYYFAVRVNEPTSSPWYLGFDDFRLELTPSCVAPVGLSATVTTLTTATINWNASPSVPANGYQYFYSTINTAPADSATPSGSVGAGITTASLTGLTANSTYYFWVRSVCDGTMSSAWGGPGTFFTGYCPSNPSSNDANGITNVQLGTTNFPTTDVTYFYHATPIVNLAQGINSNVQVTFATGYNYMTTIWIDFNNNLVFEASEQVFTGVSLPANPTTFNASFIMPASAALGQHRMRIGTQDDEFATPNPCYSGLYGVTLDFEVNIIEASCTPPAATATISADCANNQFFVAVNVTNLGSGTPAIVVGGTSTPVTTVGTVQVGPFANASSQTVVLTNGADATCDVALGTFTYNCPPSNDNCPNAVSLTVNPDLGCGVVMAGTTAGAMESMAATPCFGNPDDDVWFSFVATATAHNVSLLNVVAVTGTSTDMYFQVLSGTCAASTSVLCSDNDSAIVNGLTVGNTYYVRVYSYYNTSTNTFNICVGTLPPAPGNDACATAIAVPSFPYTNSQDATTATNNGGFITACTTGGAEMNDGVWYTVVGNGGTLTIAMTNVVGWDPQLAAFTGSCGNFTCVTSVDAGGTSGNETITIADSVLGTTYYINAGHYSGFGDSPEGPFTITVTSSVLSTNSFDNANFTYYPNPVKDVLNLSYNKDITSVAVFNLIGQQVISTEFNAANGQLDMSTLSSGAYIVKVTSENTTKSIKVIKE